MSGRRRSASPRRWREDDRARHRSRSRSPRRDRRDRSRSPRREEERRRRDDHPPPPAPAAAAAPPPPGDEEAKHQARIARLAAWRAGQATQQAPQAEPPAAAAAAPAPVPPPPPPPPPADPVAVAAAAARAAAAALAANPPPPPPPVAGAATDGADSDVDPLDAFMSREVAPEAAAAVAAAAAASARETDAATAAAVAAGRPIGADEDEDAEPIPDATLTLTPAEVKRVIGPGGATIKAITQKSKARVQVVKQSAAAVAAAAAAAAAEAGGDAGGEEDAAKPALITVHLFGPPHALEKATRLIREAADNLEQKARQRAAAQDKKKEARWAARRVYHLRHARDYEALGVPVGAPKADCTAAYRALARVWHPDKQAGKGEAERAAAGARFQAIAAAYEALMTTDEDTEIGAIEGGGRK